jgi:acetyl-CoA carboxylase biotin carboxyl carrier protein
MSDVVDYLDSELPALLEMLRATDIRQLEVQDGSLSVRLSRVLATRPSSETDADSASVDPVAPEPVRVEVVSPLVGTFYRAPQPGAPPLVIEGSQVEDDTIVGIVEALQLPTEVEAGYRGFITRVLASNGQVVEYGQALFEVTVSE